MKSQPTKWEKIFTNNITDNQGKIHKEFIPLSSRRQKKRKKAGHLIKKWAKYLNRHFLKEDIQIANRYEKFLNIINHQENANKNHNEISLHTCQNGYYQKDKKQ